MTAPATPARLLTPAQVAARLSLSTSYLAKLRCLTSTGPVFIRIGSSIRYPEDQLEAFIERQPRRRSTSDTGAGA